MKEHHRKGPLAACVRNALERYFNDLDGEKPGSLYALVISEIERPLLEAVMHHAQSNQCKAARMLGINRNTLRKKLKLYGLE
ncbi:MAG: DNA-binding transcriptional regulator Fis [Gammaproteobacteria bacterium]|nr:DNA-binding transcriptional regulator Fis [Gammaproteobacteria bacterium]